MRLLAQTFYRLLGLMFAMLGSWILYHNLAEIRYSGLILLWILSAGFFGVVGGLLFLRRPGEAQNQSPEICGMARDHVSCPTATESSVGNLAVDASADTDQALNTARSRQRS